MLDAVRSALGSGSATLFTFHRLGTLSPDLTIRWLSAHKAIPINNNDCLSTLVGIAFDLDDEVNVSTITIGSKSGLDSPTTDLETNPFGLGTCKAYKTITDYFNVSFIDHIIELKVKPSQNGCSSKVDFGVS